MNDSNSQIQVWPKNPKSSCNCAIKIKEIFLTKKIFSFNFFFKSEP